MAPAARVVATLAFAALALQGCTSYRPPKVDVASVTIGDASPEGVVVEFILDATNENNDPLPLKSIDYRLTLDGREVFHGSRSPERTLPKNGEQKIRVPAVVRLNPGDPPLAGTRRYVLSGQITYLEPGKIAELLFDNEVSQPSSPFSDSGNVEFPAAP
jgi:hypothetical protein